MANTNIRILQANLGRARMAHDMTYATCTKNEVDILVIGEPNKKIVNTPRWITDRRLDVAVLLRNRQIKVKEVKTGGGYVCIHLEKLCLICCYSSPNITLDQYK